MTLRGTQLYIAKRFFKKITFIYTINMLWSGFHALEGLVMKIKQFRDFTTESVLNCLKKTPKT